MTTSVNFFFGFPCQDISVAGKQTGLTGNRSGLFFTVAGLIRQLEEEKRPKYLLIENVKNLLSINRGWDFTRILIELDEIGYDAEWDVLNTAEVLPQNRERIFIVGHLRGRGGRKVFPIQRTDFMPKAEWVLWREQNYMKDPEVNLFEIKRKKYNTESLEWALTCVGIRYGIEQLLEFVEENNLSIDTEYYKEKIREWEIEEKGS